ncbi:putative E3 ubiquitin-protein ligase [Porphyridium purpureum]|uniref:Putative E3 ubiquitin-protein ligase n=1 Tax=Porphyridium purpureum TaxID=35688 RepID=A0A5J4YJU0_PORPP|nr:putative E3 ubiquitin-protein ligase [Porphyridium purpureum]|eukprot:POR4629..scf297_16
MYSVGTVPGAVHYASFTIHQGVGGTGQSRGGRDGGRRGVASRACARECCAPWLRDPRERAAWASQLLALLPSDVQLEVALRRTEGAARPHATASLQTLHAALAVLGNQVDQKRLLVECIEMSVLFVIRQLVLLCDWQPHAASLDERQHRLASYNDALAKLERIVRALRRDGAARLAYVKYADLLLRLSILLSERFGGLVATTLRPDSTVQNMSARLYELAADLKYVSDGDCASLQIALNSGLALCGNLMVLDSDAECTHALSEATALLSQYIPHLCADASGVQAEIHKPWRLPFSRASMAPDGAVKYREAVTSALVAKSVLDVWMTRACHAKGAFEWPCENEAVLDQLARALCQWLAAFMAFTRIYLTMNSSRSATPENVACAAFLALEEERLKLSSSAGGTGREKMRRLPTARDGALLARTAIHAHQFVRLATDRLDPDSARSSAVTMLLGISLPEMVQSAVAQLPSVIKTLHRATEAMMRAPSDAISVLMQLANVCKHLYITIACCSSNHRTEHEAVCAFLKSLVVAACDHRVLCTSLVSRVTQFHDIMAVLARQFIPLFEFAPAVASSAGWGIEMERIVGELGSQGQQNANVTEKFVVCLGTLLACLRHPRHHGKLPTGRSATGLLRAWIRCVERNHESRRDMKFLQYGAYLVKLCLTEAREDSDELDCVSLFNSAFTSALDDAQANTQVTETVMVLSAALESASAGGPRRAELLDVIQTGGTFDAIYSFHGETLLHGHVYDIFAESTEEHLKICFEDSEIEAAALLFDTVAERACEKRTQGLKSEAATLSQAARNLFVTVQRARQTRASHGKPGPAPAHTNSSTTPPTDGGLDAWKAASIKCIQFLDRSPSSSRSEALCALDDLEQQLWTSTSAVVLPFTEALALMHDVFKAERRMYHRIGPAQAAFIRGSVPDEAELELQWDSSCGVHFCALLASHMESCNDTHLSDSATAAAQRMEEVVDIALLGLSVPSLYEHQGLRLFLMRTIAQNVSSTVEPCVFEHVLALHRVKLLLGPEFDDSYSKKGSDIVTSEENDQRVALILQELKAIQMKSAGSEQDMNADKEDTCELALPRELLVGIDVSALFSLLFRVSDTLAHQVISELIVLCAASHPLVSQVWRSVVVQSLGGNGQSPSDCALLPFLLRDANETVIARTRASMYTLLTLLVASGETLPSALTHTVSIQLHERAREWEADVSHVQARDVDLMEFLCYVSTTAFCEGENAESVRLLAENICNALPLALAQVDRDLDLNTSEVATSVGKRLEPMSLPIARRLCVMASFFARARISLVETGLVAEEQTMELLLALQGRQLSSQNTTDFTDGITEGDSHADTDDSVEPDGSGNDDEAVVSEVVDSRLCTFLQTGENFVAQPWFFCYSCGLMGSEGVCAVCIRRCHGMCDVAYSRFSRFFCDCGAASASMAESDPNAMRTSKCKCIPSAVSDTSTRNETVVAGAPASGERKKSFSSSQLSLFRKVLQGSDRNRSLLLTQFYWSMWSRDDDAEAHGLKQIATAVQSGIMTDGFVRPLVSLACRLCPTYGSALHRFLPKRSDTIVPVVSGAAQVVSFSSRRIAARLSEVRGTDEHPSSHFPVEWCKSSVFAWDGRTGIAVLDSTGKSILFATMAANPVGSVERESNSGTGTRKCTLAQEIPLRVVSQWPMDFRPLGIVFDLEGSVHGLSTRACVWNASNVVVIALNAEMQVVAWAEMELGFQGTVGSRSARVLSVSWLPIDHLSGTAGLCIVTSEFIKIFDTASDCFAPILCIQPEQEIVDACVVPIRRSSECVSVCFVYACSNGRFWWVTSSLVVVGGERCVFASGDHTEAAEIAELTSSAVIQGMQKNPRRVLGTELSSPLPLDPSREGKVDILDGPDVRFVIGAAGVNREDHRLIWVLLNHSAEVHTETGAETCPNAFRLHFDIDSESAEPWKLRLCEPLCASSHVTQALFGSCAPANGQDAIRIMDASADVLVSTRVLANGTPAESGKMHVFAAVRPDAASTQLYQTQLEQVFEDQVVGNANDLRHGILGAQFHSAAPFHPRGSGDDPSEVTFSVLCLTRRGDLVLGVIDVATDDAGRAEHGRADFILPRVPQIPEFPPAVGFIEHCRTSKEHIFVSGGDIAPEDRAAASRRLLGIAPPRSSTSTSGPQSSSGTFARRLSFRSDDSLCVSLHSSDRHSVIVGVRVLVTVGTGPRAISIAVNGHKRVVSTIRPGSSGLTRWYDLPVSLEEARTTPHDMLLEFSGNAKSGPSRDMILEIEKIAVCIVRRAKVGALYARAFEEKQSAALDSRSFAECGDLHFRHPALPPSVDVGEALDVAAVYALVLGEHAYRENMSTKKLKSGLRQCVEQLCAALDVLCLVRNAHDPVAALLFVRERMRVSSASDERGDREQEGGSRNWMMRVLSVQLGSAGLHANSTAFLIAALVYACLSRFDDFSGRNDEGDEHALLAECILRVRQLIITDACDTLSVFNAVWVTLRLSVLAKFHLLPEAALVAAHELLAALLSAPRVSMRAAAHDALCLCIGSRTLHEDQPVPVPPFAQKSYGVGVDPASKSNITLCNYCQGAESLGEYNGLVDVCRQVDCCCEELVVAQQQRQHLKCSADGCRALITVTSPNGETASATAMTVNGWVSVDGALCSPCFQKRVKAQCVRESWYFRTDVLLRSCSGTQPKSPSVSLFSAFSSAVFVVKKVTDASPCTTNSGWPEFFFTMRLLARLFGMTSQMGHVLDTESCCSFTLVRHLWRQAEPENLSHGAGGRSGFLFRAFSSLRTRLLSAVSSSGSEIDVSMDWREAEACEMARLIFDVILRTLSASSCAKPNSASALSSPVLSSPVFSAASIRVAVFYAQSREAFGDILLDLYDQMLTRLESCIELEKREDANPVHERTQLDDQGGFRSAEYYTEPQKTALRSPVLGLIANSADKTSDTGEGKEAVFGSGTRGFLHAYTEILESMIQVCESVYTVAWNKKVQDGCGSAQSDSFLIRLKQRVSRCCALRVNEDSDSTSGVYGVTLAARRLLLALCLDDDVEFRLAMNESLFSRLFSSITALDCVHGPSLRSEPPSTQVALKTTKQQLQLVRRLHEAARASPGGWLLYMWNAGRVQTASGSTQNEERDRKLHVHALLRIASNLQCSSSLALVVAASAASSADAAKLLMLADDSARQVLHTVSTGQSEVDSAQVAGDEEFGGQRLNLFEQLFFADEEGEGDGTMMITTVLRTFLLTHPLATCRELAAELFVSSLSVAFKTPASSAAASPTLERARKELSVALTASVQALSTHGAHAQEFTACLVRNTSLIQRALAEMDVSIVSLARICMSTWARAAARVLHHPCLHLYESLERVMALNGGFFLESEPCFACGSALIASDHGEKDSKHPRVALDALRVEAKYSDKCIYSRFAERHAIAAVSLRVSFVGGAGDGGSGGESTGITPDASSGSPSVAAARLRKRNVERVRVYYSPALVQEGSALKRADFKWEYAGDAVPVRSSISGSGSTTSRSGSGQNGLGGHELLVSFPTPLDAGCLRLELVENDAARMGAQPLQCPRCSRPVTHRYGVCATCRDNAHQCRQCRNINYENLDALLCNECGYSRHAKFSFFVAARRSFAPDVVRCDADRRQALSRIDNLLGAIDSAGERIASLKRHVSRSLGFAYDSSTFTSTSPVSVGPNSGTLAFGRGEHEFSAATVDHGHAEDRNVHPQTSGPAGSDTATDLRELLRTLFPDSFGTAPGEMLATSSSVSRSRGAPRRETLFGQPLRPLPPPPPAPSDGSANLSPVPPVPASDPLPPPLRTVISEDSSEPPTGSVAAAQADEFARLVADDDETLRTFHGNGVSMPVGGGGDDDEEHSDSAILLLRRPISAFLVEAREREHGRGRIAPAPTGASRTESENPHGAAGETSVTSRQLAAGSPGLVSPSDAGARITALPEIEALVRLYGEKCREAYITLCHQVKLLEAQRDELLRYDSGDYTRARRLGFSWWPDDNVQHGECDGGRALDLHRIVYNCYGCGIASMRHALALLRILVSAFPDALHSVQLSGGDMAISAPQEPFIQQVVECMHLVDGRGGAVAEHTAAIMTQDGIIDFVASVVSSNNMLSELMYDLLKSRILRVVYTHPVPLALAPSARASMLPEMALLQALARTQRSSIHSRSSEPLSCDEENMNSAAGAISSEYADDPQWEARLRTVLLVLLHCTRTGYGVESAYVANAVILPCIHEVMGVKAKTNVTMDLGDRGNFFSDWLAGAFSFQAWSSSRSMQGDTSEGRMIMHRNAWLVKLLLCANSADVRRETCRLLRQLYGATGDAGGWSSDSSSGDGALRLFCDVFELFCDNLSDMERCGDEVLALLTDMRLLEHSVRHMRNDALVQRLIRLADLIPREAEDLAFQSARAGGAFRLALGTTVAQLIRLFSRLTEAAFLGTTTAARSASASDGASLSCEEQEHVATQIIRAYVALQGALVTRNPAVNESLHALNDMLGRGKRDVESNGGHSPAGEHLLFRERGVVVRSATGVLRSVLAALQAHPSQQHGMQGHLDDELAATRVLADLLQDLVCPKRETPTCKMVLSKSPTQEEFIRGHMARTPYSSADMPGPLMRDVKNKICTDLELTGLLDDDFGVELLVAGKLIKLDLPIMKVYQCVWLPSLERDGRTAVVSSQPQNRTRSRNAILSIAGSRPMTVIYRLAGLDGEATEPIVDTLDDAAGADSNRRGENVEDQDEREREQEALYHETPVFVSAGGLPLVILLLQLIREDSWRSDASRLVFEPCARLLVDSCALRMNRRALLGVRNVIGALLDCAARAFAADTLAAIACANALLSVAEQVLNQCEEDEKAEEHQRGASRASMSAASEQVMQRLIVFLGQLDALSEQARVALFRVLPILSRGSPDAARDVIDYFDSRLNWNEFVLLDRSATSAGDSGSIDKRSAGLSVVNDIVSILRATPSNVRGADLRHHVIARNMLGEAVRIVAARLPLPRHEFAMQWTDAVEERSLYVLLELMQVVVVALGEHGLYEHDLQTIRELFEPYVALLITLENVSSFSGVGVVAEDILDRLALDERLQHVIDKQRRAIRDSRRSAAQASREAALKQMEGLALLSSSPPTHGAPQAAASTDVPAVASSSSAPEARTLEDQALALKMMDELEDEVGPACLVCGDGYVSSPANVLGLYVHCSRVKVGAPQHYCFTSVTHFNAVHLSCHAASARADRALRTPRDEWEGARLRNTNTKCNNLMPLLPPRALLHARGELEEQGTGMGQIDTSGSSALTAFIAGLDAFRDRTSTLVASGGGVSSGRNGIGGLGAGGSSVLQGSNQSNTHGTNGSSLALGLAYDVACMLCRLCKRDIQLFSGETDGGGVLSNMSMLPCMLQNLFYSLEPAPRRTHTSAEASQGGVAELELLDGDAAKCLRVLESEWLAWGGDESVCDDSCEPGDSRKSARTRGAALGAVSSLVACPLESWLDQAPRVLDLLAADAVRDESREQQDASALWILDEPSQRVHLFGYLHALHVALKSPEQTGEAHGG